MECGSDKFRFDVGSSCHPRGFAHIGSEYVKQPDSAACNADPFTEDFARCGQYPSTNPDADHCGRQSERCCKAVAKLGELEQLP